jgi:hypothetical protein
MNVHEWHFRLDGDQFDIKGIAELFTHEVKIIKDENNPRGKRQSTSSLFCRRYQKRDRPTQFALS